MWLSSSGTASYDMAKNLGSIKEAAENPENSWGQKEIYHWLL